MAETSIQRTDLERPNLPAYMQGATDSSLEEMKPFAVVPRFKIVQKSSSSDLLRRFGIGSVIIPTANEMIVKCDGEKSGAVQAIPIFFYVEYLTIKDINDKSDSPIIMDRSFDQNGEIARRARNKEARTERYGGDSSKLKKRHMEVFNFIVMLTDGPFAGTMGLITFAKGEHRTGRQIISRLLMRKAPIYGTVWTINTSQRKSNDYEWFGYDVNFLGWTPAETFEAAKRLHEEAKDLHAKRSLNVTPESDDEFADGEGQSFTDEM